MRLVIVEPERGRCFLFPYANPLSLPFNFFQFSFVFLLFHFPFWEPTNPSLYLFHCRLDLTGNLTHSQQICQRHCRIKLHNFNPSKPIHTLFTHHLFFCSSADRRDSSGVKWKGCFQLPISRVWSPPSLRLLSAKLPRLLRNFCRFFSLPHNPFCPPPLFLFFSLILWHYDMFCANGLFSDA